MKSKQLNQCLKCWRECGSHDVDHSHVFWKSQKIKLCWEMICELLNQALGYKFDLCSSM